MPKIESEMDRQSRIAVTWMMSIFVISMSLMISQLWAGTFINAIARVGFGFLGRPSEDPRALVVLTMAVLLVFYVMGASPYISRGGLAIRTDIMNAL